MYDQSDLIFPILGQVSVAGNRRSGAAPQPGAEPGQRNLDTLSEKALMDALDHVLAMVSRTDGATMARSCASGRAWYFFRARSSNMASPQACLEDPSAASRIAPGCRAGWTAGTSSGLTRLHCSHGPFRYPFPASRHQPNPQSRRAKGRRTGSPPQPWSCAFDDPDHQRGFTPRRPALDAVIHGHTLRYLLPCSRSRVSLGQYKNAPVSRRSLACHCRTPGGTGDSST